MLLNNLRQFLQKRVFFLVCKFLDLFGLHHELDELAGTWSQKEAAKFQKNTADFEKIDKDLWP